MRKNFIDQGVSESAAEKRVKAIAEMAGEYKGTQIASNLNFLNYK